MNGVPDTIVYQEKPRATSASKVRQNFLPINGREFAPGNQIHFNLSTGRLGAYLDPKATYLKFKFTNKDAAAANAIERIYGILNGTANYILSTMEATGADFASTLKEA